MQLFHHNCYEEVFFSRVVNCTRCTRTINKMSEKKHLRVTVKRAKQRKAAPLCKFQVIAGPSSESVLQNLHDGGDGDGHTHPFKGGRRDQPCLSTAESKYRHFVLAWWHQAWTP